MAEPSSPPKRPRLSLQIKAISQGPSTRNSRVLAAAVNPTSPTAFNTLSNVYVTAIDRSTPVYADPPTAINTKGQPQLQLWTHGFAKERETPKAFGITIPETPLTAQPLSPAVAMEINFPSTMTATPPLSAGPEAHGPKGAFPFSSSDTPKPPSNHEQLLSPRGSHRRPNIPPTSGQLGSLPYQRTRSLHSILRNSPLPPRSAQSPISPRRQSLRLKEKAARRVGYNDPLTQTIITNKYTRSHVDLLCDDASPYSPENAQENQEMVLDLAMAYSGNETRDGGQTPGPFEEMRRRMAGLGTSSPVSPSGGIRKRKKKEKKRRWVWTIGQEEGEEEANGDLSSLKEVGSGATTTATPSLSGVPILATPRLPKKGRQALSIDTVAAAKEPDACDVLTPSIETEMSQPSTLGESEDIEMSETSSVFSLQVEPNRDFTPGDMDLDMITPTMTRKAPSRSRSVSRLMSEELVDATTGRRRDTPIPADLLGH
ncbi:uncharacterized protein E0L32_009284 [Thyridium curvatum]|uniref:Uncharacterized protein n=1 Tax=Thyridium curvatum TaxID=1093900 RepID=A0A507AX92_9PEZI|nr:uncharacterized protein E0L32_009284 [Thyridium curvatum]TPX09541.1 hypothetical protein E0L32_009284 [Thyridium curvatum]